KHPLISKTPLTVNYAGWRIHPTDPVELDTYPTGDKVTLPDGLLVKAADAPAVYVISDGNRLSITSGEVFESMGFKWESIVSVDEATLLLHPLGDVIEAPAIDAISEASL
ncbi:MAG: hypothetical protein AAB429_02980, partial [Patescibacteria group bacterium]